MLQIFTKSPHDKEGGSTKTFEWYCGDRLYVPDPEDQLLLRLHATHVEASGNELIWVREHFTNIPMFKISRPELQIRSMRWTGDDAQYIAFCISEYSEIREQARLSGALAKRPRDTGGR